MDATLTRLLSWLLWCCELVLFAVLVITAGRLWSEFRHPEREGRDGATGIAVTLLATVVAAVAVPIAATALHS